jgi:membrane fusion protein, multidrug efflux system
MLTLRRPVGDIGDYLDAIGTVTAVYTATITAQATGLVKAVHYREGRLVRRGDELIDIDPGATVTGSGALDRDTDVLA